MHHVSHPQLIWRDATAEIEQPPFFEGYDISRIVAESLMLNVLTNSHVADVGSTTYPPPLAPPPADECALETSEDASPPPSAAASEQPRRLRLSLQDMLTTSVALRSDLDVDVVDTYPTWPLHLFPPDAPAQGSSRASFVSVAESGERDDVPLHVAHALASLQREVLLLRNELAFELWISRENVKQIARLFEHRIHSRDAEIERQGLVSLSVWIGALGRVILTSSIGVAQQVAGVQIACATTREATQGSEGPRRPDKDKVRGLERRAAA
jgi:hypothetical protein